MKDRIVAHRGNAVEHRENSLASLQSAIDLGCRYVEFDVQMSSDGVPCLLHDAYLTRLFGKDRMAVRTEWQDLKGLGIHSLADAVELLSKAPEVKAFVEIKTDSVFLFDRSSVLDRILPMLPREGQCVVISFDPVICEMARDRGHRVGLIILDMSDIMRARCRLLQPEFVFCDQLKIQSQVWPEYTWCSYEVSSHATAQRLTGLGVELLETMSVRKMLQ